MSAIETPFRDKRIDDVVRTMRQMSSEGIAIFLFKAREIAAEYPATKGEARVIPLEKWRSAKTGEHHERA